MKKIITFEKSLEFPSMIGKITAITLDQHLKFKDSSSIDGKLIIEGKYKRTEASRLEEEFHFDLPTEIILTEKLDLESSKIDIDDFYYEVENNDTINCHIDILVEGIEIVDIDELEEENIVLTEHKKVIDRIETNNDTNSVDNLEIDSNTNIKDYDDLSSKEDDNVRECDGDVNPDYEEYSEEESINTDLDTKEKIEVNNNLINNNDFIENLEVNAKVEPHEITNSIQNNIEVNGREENIHVEEKEENMNIKEIEQDKNITVNEENVGSLFTSLKDSEETFSTYAVYIVRQEETVETIMEKYSITKEELENYNDISSIAIGSKVIIPLKNE